MDRICIVGGSKNVERDYVFTQLDLIDQQIQIESLVFARNKIQTPAEEYASKWAWSKNLVQKYYKPQYAIFADQAIKIRNQRMLKEEQVTIVLSFGVPDSSPNKETVLSVLQLAKELKITTITLRQPQSDSNQS